MSVACLVSVVVWLEWSILRNAQVGGLVFGQFGELGTQMFQMGSSNLFIQLKTKSGSDYVTQRAN